MTSDPNSSLFIREISVADFDLLSRSYKSNEQTVDITVLQAFNSIL